MVVKPGIAVGAIGNIPALRAEVLAKYPNAKFHEVLPVLGEAALIEFLQGCDSAVVGLEPLNERVMAACPNIKAIGKFGVGCDNVDFDALRKRNVRFGYQPGVNKLAVAEMTIAFMLIALRWFSSRAYAMREGQGPKTRVGRQLTNRVVGLHGCGFIGKEVVRLLQPFNCEIIAHDTLDFPDFYRQYNVKPVGFDELLARSEVLSLHIPRPHGKDFLYNAETLARLRPDAVLINTCRGGIVDEVALADRLATNENFAACVDAFLIEPPTDMRLLKMPNIFSTPHMGASTIEARLAMGRAAVRFLEEGTLVPEGFAP